MSQPVTASTIPPRLRPGDTVAVCAPAGPVDPVRLDAGVRILSQRYRVRMDRDALLARHGYLAGDDERRAAELNAAFSDPDVRAVILVRGGYGLTRILDRLDEESLRQDPVPIVAFSDGTALLSWALERAGVRGVHGPMVGQLGELPESSAQAFFSMLENERSAGTIITGSETLGHRVAPSRTGPLLGGNLCIWSHLVGTDFMPSLEGAILLMEDVGERPYAVDRYLTHLYAAGAIDGTVAAVVGDFVGCGEPRIEDSPDAFQVIDERLQSFDLPGVRVPGIGHGADNMPLPFGGRCTVDAVSGTFSIDEPAVS